MPITDNPYGTTLGSPQNNAPLLSMASITDLQAWGPGAWLRYQVAWSAIERSPNQYSWSLLDWAVQLCNANQVSILLPVQGCPNWRQTTDYQGNFVSSSQLTQDITNTGPVSQIHITALHGGSNLYDGAIIAIGAEGTNIDQVKVVGNYVDTNTTITVANRDGTPWTPTYAHLATSTWVVAADFQFKSFMPPTYPGSQLSDPTQFTAFAQMVAQRYNGTVRYNGTGPYMWLDGIQIGNEDYDSFGAGITDRNYQGTLLSLVAQQAYPAIRNAPYGGYVGLCAVRKTIKQAVWHIQTWLHNLWSNNNYALANLIKNDPLFFVDFHYYRDGTFNLDPTTQQPAGTGADVPSVATEVATIIAANKADGVSPQVWCNETGWPIYHDFYRDQYVTDTVTVTQQQQEQYIWDMLDALRRGGNGNATTVITKCMVYTSNPNAQVQPKSLMNSPHDPTHFTTVDCSGERSGIVQTYTAGHGYPYPPGVEQYMLAYSDPALGKGVVQYVAQYPLWISTSPPPPPAKGGFGTVLFAQTRFGDGVTSRLRPLTSPVPVTYNISTSKYAAAVPTTYQIIAGNTDSMRLYYIIVPPSAISINGDGTIIAPDTITYTPRPVTGRTLVGTPQLQGYMSMTWSWSKLLVAEFSKIISYYNPLNPTVTLVFPSDEGTWVQRQVVMHPPTYGTQSTVVVNNVSIVFTRIF